MRDRQERVLNREERVREQEERVEEQEKRGGRSLGRKILEFPLTRIVLYVVAIGLGLFLLQISIGALADTSPGGPGAWLSVVLGLPLAHGIYLGLVRAVERRWPREIGLRGAAGEAGRGALAGAAIIGFVVATLWLLGVYRVTGVNPPTAMIAALLVSLLSGYLEELLFRGVLFRIVEESLGSWLALGISSGLFGLAHVFNPNATWISTGAIVVEAGVLLGAVYMVTRRVWFAAGLHFAWNMTQGGVFGIRVSGADLGGLLEARLTGPVWLSGGEFGAEASVVAVLAGLTAAGLSLWVAIRAGHVRRPFWRRPAPEGRGSRPAPPHPTPAPGDRA